MTLIILDYALSGPRSKPLIGLDNIFSRSDATVTVSSEVSGGGENQNAYDGVPYDKWTPESSGINWLRATFSEPVSCNYVGLHRHNVSSTNGSYRVQYSTQVDPDDSDDSDWTDALSWSTPSDDTTTMSSFSEVSSKHWRVVFNTGDILSIGILHLGKSIELPRGPAPGFTPPELAEVPIFVTNYTGNGNPTPRSVIRRAAELDIELDLVEDQWVRNYWYQFRRDAETNNFFFQWSPYYYPSHVAYCWIDRKGVPAVKYDRVMHATIELKCMAAME